MLFKEFAPNYTDQSGRELLGHGMPMFPVAYYYVDIGRDNVCWHWHDELEIIYAVSGEAKLLISDTEFLARAPSLVFINGGVLHGIQRHASQGCIIRSLVFHPRLIGSMDTVFWYKYVLPLTGDATRPYMRLDCAKDWQTRILPYFDKAWEHTKGQGDGYEFEVRENLSRVVYSIGRSITEPQKAPSEKSLRSGERVKIMLKYIEDNCDGELTLDKIAKSASISQNECLRCFNKVLGCTPIKLIKQMRIQKAALLLAQTDKKISDIGAACGFKEMSYFAKTFRELKGCAPGEFRAKSRQPQTGGAPQNLL